MSDDPIDWSRTLEPCGDASCIFGARGGMHTNGGCAHLKLDGAETRRLLRLMAEELKELRHRFAGLDK